MTPIPRVIASVFGYLVVFWIAILANADQCASQDAVKVYLFWQEGCPYCARARSELERLAEGEPRLNIQAIEVGSDASDDILFGRAIRYFSHEQAAVPLVVVGGRSFLGFMSDGRSSSLYREAIANCLRSECPDVLAALAGPVADGDSNADTATPELKDRAIVPDTFVVPILGEIRTRDMSLPALTVLLAAVDGFNPCAMWVLVFLIGLLLGLEDVRRMWILGGAFLFATAAMYFAVMAAWLNLVLYMRAVIWVRMAIGAIAIAAGIYFLREYWTKPEAVCRVTNPGRRLKIMDAFRSVVDQNQLILAVFGIMALAVMVNFIELLCSAGIPAVYTQLLALSDLSDSAYYGYLLLYISVFMLDDVAIFATAMFALRVTGMTNEYARYSHLIGGCVLLAIGAVLMLRPELLSFS